MQRSMSELVAIVQQRIAITQSALARTTDHRVRGHLTRHLNDLKDTKIGMIQVTDITSQYANQQYLLQQDIRDLHQFKN